mgnify:FL=1
MPAPTVPADAIALLARTGPRNIINYLVKHPNSYYGEIREATVTAVSSLTRDLRLLESIGVIRTDVEQPVGERRGRAPRYTVDVDRIDALISELRTQLLG